jgi:von Willebrand factor type A domain
VSVPRQLPVADAPLLGGAARRVRLVRAVLIGALALLVAAAVVLAARARAQGAPAAPAATGRTTEIVLDLSGSVGGSTFRVASNALGKLAASRSPVGLVLFSDTAEEALPPGSPPAELRPFARILTPRAQRPSSETLSRPPTYAPNPWYPSFTGGTSISAGLAAARQALERDHVRGRVLLISDLGDTPDDRPSMRRELVALAQAGIPLKVLVLPNAFSSDLLWFRSLEGPGKVQAALPAPAAPTPRPVVHTGFPLSLAVAAVLLALALGAFELLGVSLRWGAAR